MSTVRRSSGIEAAGLLAILAAGGAILAQQHAQHRLAGAAPLVAREEVSAALAAARQRVSQLEKRREAAPQAAPVPPAVALMAAPEAKKLQLRVEAARSRESVRAAYGPLLKALALDPAAEAQFVELLAQERLTARDALVAAQAQGISSIEGYKAAVEEAVSHEDEEISALLNPTGFAQFDAYRQELPEQQTVSRLDGRLTSIGEPLTESQQAGLVQLISRMEPPAYLQNQAFLSLIGMDDAPLSPAMVSAAPSILSPTQTAALRTQEAAWLAKTQLQQALRPRAARSAP